MHRAKLCYAIFGGILCFSGMSSSGFSEGTIDIFSLNSEIKATEDVFVTGFVSTESFYKPVKLEVYDPNGELIFSPTINFNEDGQFSWLFHPPLGKYEVTGTYEIIASHEDIPETDKIQFTVIEENEETLVPTNKNSKVESKVSSVGFLESLELTSDESKIKEQELKVKTSNSELTQNENNKIEESLDSELIYVIPITIAVVTGIIVTWMKVTSDKQNQKKKQFGV